MGLPLLTITAHAELIPAKHSLEHHNNSGSLSQQALHALEAGTEHQIPAADDSMVDRLSAVAAQTVRNFSQTGIASWYGRQFHGKRTANGETFNMNAMTAAHKTLPLNCLIRVTNKQNGKSVVVRVNDRGPFKGSRILDLSYGAAKALDITDLGTAKVSIQRIDN